MKKMGKRVEITEAELAEIVCLRRKNKDKRIEKRLHGLELRGRGLTNEQVGEEIGVHAQTVTKWMSEYKKNGLIEFAKKHHVGNHRNLSFAAEAELLAPFIECAKAGQMVEVSEILAAYEARIGRSTEKDHGRIYRVLERHGWRKIMPRSKHPKKAKEEDIEASKKLTMRLED
jgi:transposase